MTRSFEMIVALLEYYATQTASQATTSTATHRNGR